jgi:anti-sigma factor RsiW
MKMTQDRTDARDLWMTARQAFAVEGEAAAAPEPMDLAAYLDGDADPAIAAQVERWLVEDPEALATLAAAREALEARDQAPAEAIARAQAIVRGPAAAASPSRPAGWLSWLRPAQAFAWAAVACLVLVFGGAGFELGRAGFSELSPGLDAEQLADAEDFGDVGSDIL